jgi:hypothetical protein
MHLHGLQLSFERALAPTLLEKLILLSNPSLFRLSLPLAVWSLTRHTDVHLLQMSKQAEIKAQKH